MLEEVAGYASLVMGSLERGHHKEDNLAYTQRLTALWHAFLKVRRCPGARTHSDWLGMQSDGLLPWSIVPSASRSYGNCLPVRLAVR